MTNKWVLEQARRLEAEGRLAIVTAQRDDLLAVLERLEWVRLSLDDEYVDYCPWCGENADDGHSDTCPRQLVIAQAKGE